MLFTGNQTPTAHSLVSSILAKPTANVEKTPEDLVSDLFFATTFFRKTRRKFPWRNLVIPSFCGNAQRLHKGTWWQIL